MIIFKKKQLNLPSDRYKPSDNSQGYFIDPKLADVSIDFYKKCWKGNKSKWNECEIISVKRKPEKGFFELVKDFEGNSYSCHFKTQTSEGLGNEKGFSTKPLSSEEKELLFKALTDSLPSGSILSYHEDTTITPGGYNAMLKMGDRSKGTLIKSGEVQTNLEESGKSRKVNIPVWKKI